MLQGSITYITLTSWPLKSRHGESTQSPTGTEEIAIKTRVHLFIYLLRFSSRGSNIELYIVRGRNGFSVFHGLEVVLRSRSRILLLNTPSVPKLLHELAGPPKC